MDWVIEFAPPMPSQLIPTLAGLARHADKKGRGAYPSVARLAAYSCKAERSVQRDLKELRKLGLIRLGDQSKTKHLPEGKRPDVYDLALENAMPQGRAGRDEETRASRVTLASSRRRGGKQKPSSGEFSEPGTGDVDVTPDVDVTGDAGVADGVTWASQEGRRGRHPNQKKNLNDEPKDSSSSAALDEVSDDDMKEFGNFWLLYPKSRDRAATFTAWKAAVSSGADPKRITAAAVAYAKERAGEEPKYTKFSANWLRDGRYDDAYESEPQPGERRLRAVSGEGWRPFRNPENHDVYDEDLI
jgi:hypothetical protein